MFYDFLPWINCKVFFFSDYKTLRDHFLTDHYLCEEGDCADAQFTNAFRSDIDLKSHQAHEHSKAQTRQQARQERTINIDINLVPRPNSRPQRGKNSCHVYCLISYQSLVIMSLHSGFYIAVLLEPCIFMVVGCFPMSYEIKKESILLLFFFIEKTECLKYRQKGMKT